MAKKVKTTNKVLFDTIRDLRKFSNKTGVNVWEAVADKLSSSASQRAETNLLKIDKLTKENDTVIVAGKVLGLGNLSKKVTIVGFSASESAICKIQKVKGEFVQIRDYLKNNPNNKIKIIK